MANKKFVPIFVVVLVLIVTAITYNNSKKPKTLEEAVEIACRVDVNSGPPIQIMRLINEI